jgi:membrane protein
MMAASIAFYCAFSLAPTLLIVLAVAGWFFGADGARGQLFGEIHGLLGNEAAAAVQTIVEHARHPSAAGPAALLSAALLAFGASATFASLNTALNVVFPAAARFGTISSIALLVKVQSCPTRYERSNRPAAANRAEETMGGFVVAKWSAVPLKTD